MEQQVAQVATEDAGRRVLPPNLPEIYARYIRDVEQASQSVPSATKQFFEGKLRIR